MIEENTHSGEKGFNKNTFCLEVGRGEDKACDKMRLLVALAGEASVNSH